MQEDWNRALNEKERVERLEWLSRVADNRMGVAEELTWFIATLLAVVVYLKTESWLYTIPSGIAAYYFFTLPYRRHAEKAEDEYFRAAKLGKYATIYSSENADT